MPWQGFTQEYKRNHKAERAAACWAKKKEILRKQRVNVSEVTPAGGLWAAVGWEQPLHIFGAV